jgi:hypothetical protein
MKPIKNSTPQELTEEQKEMLSHYIIMDERLFGFTIKKHCYYVEEEIIDSYYVGRGKKRTLEFVKAIVYGQKGWHYHSLERNEEEKDESIYCYFIHFRNRVWRTNYVKETSELLEAIQLKHDYQKWFNKQERKKWIEKSKLKKLKSTRTKKAA